MYVYAPRQGRKGRLGIAWMALGFGMDFVSWLTDGRLRRVVYDNPYDNQFHFFL